MAPFGAPQFMPPYVESRQEATSRLGAQRADKWRQRLNALAAGLVASSGADNFGQGLARGFGGAVIGGQVYQTQEERRQQDRAEAEQAQAQREWQRDFNERELAYRQQHDQQQMEIDRARNATPARQYGALPWWMDPNVPQDIASQARADAFRGPQRSEGVSFDDWLRMTPAQRAEYGQYRGVGRADTGGEDLGTITEVLATDPVTGYPTSTFRRKITSRTPGVSSDRRTQKINVPGVGGGDPLGLRR